MKHHIRLSGEEEHELTQAIARFHASSAKLYEGLTGTDQSLDQDLVLQHMMYINEETKRLPVPAAVVFIRLVSEYGKVSGWLADVYLNGIEVEVPVSQVVSPYEGIKKGHPS